MSAGKKKEILTALFNLTNALEQKDKTNIKNTAIALDKELLRTHSTEYPDLREFLGALNVTVERDILWGNAAALLVKYRDQFSKTESPAPIVNERVLSLPPSVQAVPETIPQKISFSAQVNQVTENKCVEVYDKAKEAKKRNIPIELMPETGKFHKREIQKANNNPTENQLRNR